MKAQLFAFNIEHCENFLEIPLTLLIISTAEHLRRVPQFFISPMDHPRPADRVLISTFPSQVVSTILSKIMFVVPILVFKKSRFIDKDFRDLYSNFKLQHDLQDSSYFLARSTSGHPGGRHLSSWRTKSRSRGILQTCQKRV